MKIGNERCDASVGREELMARAGQHLRRQSDERVRIVENDHAFDPALVIAGFMHVVNECTRPGLGTGRSLSRHADAAVAEFAEVSEPVEFRQRALRIDDDGADVLGLRKVEKARFLPTVSPYMLFDVFEPEADLVEVFADAEHVFAHGGRHHVHRSREMKILNGDCRPAAEGPATALVVLLHGFGADAARGAGNDGNFIGLGWKAMPRLFVLVIAATLACEAISGFRSLGMDERDGAVFPDTVIAQLDRSFLAKYLPARLSSDSARHPEKAKASASAQ
jgi:hypothetical protein